MSECVICNIISPDEGIEATRALSLQCMESLFGVGSQGDSVMLPTPLSPTGAAPATHWLCSGEMAWYVVDFINEFAVEHSVNVSVSADENENKEEFLSRVGLSEVS